MSESYEELSGAQGRARFFRPRRYAAADLFTGAPPRLWFEEEEFTLDNISDRGVGGFVGAGQGDEDFTPQGQTGLLRLTQAGRDLFRGVAKKTRVSDEALNLVAGFELKSGYFDLQRLIVENASILAANEHIAGTGAAPAEYREFCLEAAAFVGGYLQRIDAFVRPVSARITDAERNKIANDMAAAAEDDWIKICDEGNAIVREFHEDKASRIAMKSLTEKTITQMLVDGPGWARCYFKPAGYPGDYMIMNYGYERQPEGPSVKAKFLHLLGMIASRSIVSRMETLSELLAGYANERSVHEHENRFSITSVGSGPARELEELLKLTPASTSWDVTLIDQETEALNYAYNRALRLDGNERLNLNALNISFREMLTQSSTRESFMENDIIYSSGFVDYLNPLLARRFVKRLYDYVRPGGQVIIGNVNERPTGMMWALEYVTDWSLYFRTEEQMHAIAEGISGAKVSVVPDQYNAIYFLVVEKPAL